LLAARRLSPNAPAIRIGWQTGHYATNGSNYDRDRDLYFGSLSWTLPLEITGQVHGSYSFTDYDNPSSFTGFTSRRDD
jgi:hypothetical protein